MTSFLDAKVLKPGMTLIGCDEAGRGPIAGPVVGCALSINYENKGLLTALAKLGVGDSKCLSAIKRREILAAIGIDPRAIETQRRYEAKLRRYSFEFCVSEHSPEEIDRINILQAALSCMRSGSNMLWVNGSKVLVDGNKCFECEYPVEAVVKGDSKYLCIGLASIIAKEFRDEKMRELDRLYPGYDLKTHAGYPTKAHRAAIEKLGVSPIHRKSFKGVKEHVRAMPGKKSLA